MQSDSTSGRQVSIKVVPLYHSIESDTRLSGRYIVRHSTHFVASSMTVHLLIDWHRSVPHFGSFCPLVALGRISHWSDLSNMTATWIDSSRALSLLSRALNKSSPSNAIECYFYCYSINNAKSRLWKQPILAAIYSNVFQLNWFPIWKCCN